MFMVVQGTLSGMPAKSAACRAGAWPVPACTTLPISTSSTISGDNLILSNAPLMATEPNFGADIVDKAPIKLPIGVRTAETITTSFIIQICSCEIKKLKSNVKWPLGKS